MGINATSSSADWPSWAAAESIRPYGAARAGMGSSSTTPTLQQMVHSLHTTTVYPVAVAVRGGAATPSHQQIDVIAAQDMGVPSVWIAGPNSKPPASRFVMAHATRNIAPSNTLMSTHSKSDSSAVVHHRPHLRRADGRWADGGSDFQAAAALIEAQELLEHHPSGATDRRVQLDPFAESGPQGTVRRMQTFLHREEATLFQRLQAAEDATAFPVMGGGRRGHLFDTTITSAATSAAVSPSRIMRGHSPVPPRPISLINAAAEDPTGPAEPVSLPPSAATSESPSRHHARSDRIYDAALRAAKEAAFLDRAEMREAALHTKNGLAAWSDSEPAAAAGAAHRIVAAVDFAASPESNRLHAMVAFDQRTKARYRVGAATSTNGFGGIEAQRSRVWSSHGGDDLGGTLRPSDSRFTALKPSTQTGVTLRPGVVPLTSDSFDAHAATTVTESGTNVAFARFIDASQSMGRGGVEQEEAAARTLLLAHSRRLLAAHNQAREAAASGFGTNSLTAPVSTPRRTLPLLAPPPRPFPVGELVQDVRVLMHKHARQLS
jgi:hypothetical protein